MVMNFIGGRSVGVLGPEKTGVVLNNSSITFLTQTVLYTQGFKEMIRIIHKDENYP
ncbi:hypothetical protein [Candidatus Nitrosocosmicus arcticus]|uniref:hypothetical protein n=1 Tax=Candidatus Nitrosocosmicus arcticus TaxID=2035267 RepID=UPI00164769D3|nr:hypothetical protein [Candidatus Nitrosocosmicus arcticus]